MTTQTPETETRKLEMTREDVRTAAQDFAQQAREGAQKFVETIHTDEFRMTGDTVIAKVKELVHEGNVRRITVKNDEGHTIVVFPLTAGLVGVVLLPMWAALGAVLALAANYTLLVERVDTPPVEPQI
jgi:hypothetical protein